MPIKAFSIEEIRGEKTAWIYIGEDGDAIPVEDEPDPENFALKIRYFTTKARELLHQRMMRQGLMKRKGRGGERIEMVEGREDDRARMLSETVVVGWSGMLGPDGGPIPYDPKTMGEIMSTRTDVHAAVWDAVERVNLFFSKNGGSS